jgi:hypothetical protein
MKMKSRLMGLADRTGTRSPSLQEREPMAQSYMQRAELDQTNEELDLNKEELEYTKWQLSGGDALWKEYCKPSLARYVSAYR